MNVIILSWPDLDYPQSMSLSYDLASYHLNNIVLRVNCFVCGANKIIRIWIWNI